MPEFARISGVPETDSFTFRDGEIFYVIQFLFRSLCRQCFGCAFFSLGVGSHDKKGVDGHTHDGRDKVDRCEHQADDGEYKRGLCFARVLSRTAGQNSFREGKSSNFHSLRGGIIAQLGSYFGDLSASVFCLRPHYNIDTITKVSHEKDMFYTPDFISIEY